MKRSAPINRSKEYIKKIKQARLKLSESGHKSKTDEEPKTPPKDSEKDDKHDDNDEDFLDVANDVNFEEDDEENVNKSTKEDDGEKEKPAKDDAVKAPIEKAKPAPSEKESKKEPSLSPSKDTSSIDLNCVHCAIKCSSMQVSSPVGVSPVPLNNHAINFHRTFAIT